MKGSIKYFFIFLILFGSMISLHGQSRMIDSLRNLVRLDKPDTNRLNHLNALAWNISRQNPDTAIVLSNEALQLSENIVSHSTEGTDLWWAGELGIGSSFHYLGWFNYLKGDYFPALQFYQNAIEKWEILEKTGPKKWKSRIESYHAKSLGNMGSIYKEQGNYPKALDYYLKALGVFEKQGDKSKAAIVISNIGIIYYEQNEYGKALEFYVKALQKQEELGNKNATVGIFCNIGVVYRNQKKYELALDNYFKALKVAQDIGDKNSVASILGNIGTVYLDLGDYAKCEKTYLDVLEMNRKLGDKNKIAVSLGNLGSLFTTTKKYDKAEKYLLESIAIFDSIGSLNYEMQFEFSISELYTKTGKFQKALEHYQKAIAAKDSLFTLEKNKEITRKEMSYEFEKKETAQQATQDKKDAVAQANARKQKIILWFVLGGLLLVMGFAGFIFRSLYVTRKQKEIIEIKSRETEEQKMLVEEKQKEILDSIHYAKRIQQSLLPTEKYLDKNLKRLRKNQL